ncbi:MAG: hypothetical protein JWP91_418 [Fibrobacteres bacterium]|nr:hypothetical protein [Fibrobacterota bacterium]
MAPDTPKNENRGTVKPGFGNRIAPTAAPLAPLPVIPFFLCMIIPDSPRKNRSERLPAGKRRLRKTALWIAAILLILIGIRAAMPPVILHIVNRKLDQIPEYRGHIDDVDLAILRGAYQIEGVSLEKINGASRAPFFSAEMVDLSVEWGALMHGSLVGEVELWNPKLNFVVAKSKKESQTSIDSSWEDRSKEMFPLDINRFEVHQGEVHFRDLTRTPKVDIHLDHLEALAKGLTTRPRAGEALPATFHATGRAMNHANLRVDLKLNPMAKDPTFDLDAELTGLKLTALNDFLKAYAKVDAEGGTFSLYTEMAANKGSFKGYVKPLAKDVKIFSPGKKDEGGVLETIWEAMVAGVTNIMENKPKQQVATQVPLAGKFSNPQAGIWRSVGYLLRNAFISALRPNLTHSVGFEDVTGGKQSGIKESDVKKIEGEKKAGKKDAEGDSKKGK